LIVVLSFLSVAIKGVIEADLVSEPSHPWAVETAATQTKPAYAGFRSLDFPLVRAGGLGFYSRDF
jgi:hypothetical protein